MCIGGGATHAIDAAEHQPDGDTQRGHHLATDAAWPQRTLRRIFNARRRVACDFAELLADLGILLTLTQLLVRGASILEVAIKARILCLGG